MQGSPSGVKGTSLLWPDTSDERHVREDSAHLLRLLCPIMIGRMAAVEPEDLARLLVQRINAGDLEGVVSLYERNAVLALPGGQVAVGQDAIRRFYADLLQSKPTFEPGEQLPELRLGDLA